MDLFTTTAMVPARAQYECNWLTWIGSTAGCLRALGCDVDHTEVGGASGYVFSMTVHKDLCPSGPTCLDWGGLNWGITMLGRSTSSFMSGDCYTKDCINDRTREHCRAAFEMAAREVLAGRPCVMWGAYVPEFAIVNGIDNGKYILSSFKESCKEEQPPLEWDKIDAPGGPYILAFPTATPMNNTMSWHGYYTIGRGVQMLTQPSAAKGYATGLKAYELWCEALQAKRVEAFGNSYNAQCYAVSKSMIKDYLSRVALRHPNVAGELNEAIKHYETVVGHMEHVAKLFPFPGQGKVEDDAVIKAAVDALSDAQQAESKAVEALERSLKGDWSAAAAQSA
jgi:hypothetical protein